MAIEGSKTKTATWRRWSYKSSPHLNNVKAFGAVGDGVVDDTVAINAALAEGGDVFLPAGTYLTTDALVLISGTHFHGTGEASIIKSVTMANGGAGIGQRQLDVSSASGFRVDNIYFNYGGLTTFLAGCRCISATAADSYIIENCRFDTPGAAVASIGSDTYWIQNNLINGVSSDGEKHHDGWIDNWEGSHDFKILNNVINGNSIVEDGILVTGEATDGSNTACYNFEIIGNTILGTENTGIWINGRGGENYSFKVLGNTIDTVDDFFGIGVADSYDFQVSNNLIKSPDSACITLYSESGEGTLGTKDFVVSNNVCVDANEGAGTAEGQDSSILLLDTCIDGVVTGNRIKGSAHRRGIFLDTGTDNISVTGNNSDVSATLPTIYDLGTGNYVVDAAQPVALANNATPSVDGGRTFLTGGTTTITDFDDGRIGQELVILSEHAITITDGTNIFLNGSANFVMASTDSLHLVQKADGKWYEIARSVN